MLAERLILFPRSRREPRGRLKSWAQRAPSAVAAPGRRKEMSLILKGPSEVKPGAGARQLYEVPRPHGTAAALSESAASGTCGCVAPAEPSPLVTKCSHCYPDAAVEPCSGEVTNSLASRSKPALRRPGWGGAVVLKQQNRTYQFTSSNNWYPKQMPNPQRKPSISPT